MYSCMFEKQMLIMQLFLRGLSQHWCVKAAGLLERIVTYSLILLVFFLYLILKPIMLL